MSEPATRTAPMKFEYDFLEQACPDQVQKYGLAGAMALYKASRGFFEEIEEAVRENGIQAVVNVFKQVVSTGLYPRDGSLPDPDELLKLLAELTPDEQPEAIQMFLNALMRGFRKHYGAETDAYVVYLRCKLNVGPEITDRQISNWLYVERWGTDGSERSVKDVLNRNEYDIERISRATVSPPGVPTRAELETSVELAHDWLVVHQRSTRIDRFGLKSLSRVELEHARQQTMAMIADLERRTDDRNRTWRQIGATVFGTIGEKVIDAASQLTSVATSPDFELWLKRKQLSEIELLLKTPPPPQPKKAPWEEEVEAAEHAAKTEAEINRRFEELANRYPDQRDSINRRRRRIVDELRDRG